MTLNEAVEARVSRRKFVPLPLTSEAVNTLTPLVETYNQAAGLHMQIIQDCGDAFRGLTRNYGLFSGVSNYIALVAPTTLRQAKEKLGYYGEMLVLHATALGLGTCWIGGTFDRNHCRYDAGEDEALLCVIALGAVLEKPSVKEALIKKSMSRKPLPLDALYASDETPPDWFIQGVRAASKAPSAANRRPVRFSWSDGAASAFVEPYTDATPIDLGIAKAHFAVGAGLGHWDWGNRALYVF